MEAGWHRAREQRRSVYHHHFRGRDEESGQKQSMEEERVLQHNLTPFNLPPHLYLHLHIRLLHFPHPQFSPSHLQNLPMHPTKPTWTKVPLVRSSQWLQQPGLRIQERHFDGRHSQSNPSRSAHSGSPCGCSRQLPQVQGFGSRRDQAFGLESRHRPPSESEVSISSSFFPLLFAGIVGLLKSCEMVWIREERKLVNEILRVTSW